MSDARTAQVENNHRLAMQTHDTVLLDESRPAFNVLSAVHVTNDADEYKAAIAATPYNAYMVTVQLPNGVTLTVTADGTVQTSATRKDTGGYDYAATDRWYDVLDNGALEYSHGQESDVTDQEY